MATLMPDSKVPASSAIKRVSPTGASKYDVKLSSLKPPAAPRTMLTNLAAALWEGAPLIWRPSAVTDAGNGAPLIWCRAERAAPEIGPYRLPDFHADTVAPA